MCMFIAKNKNDPRKLWKELHKTLNRAPEVKLPSHQSSKSLANRFASFFTDKIKAICEIFTSIYTSFHPQPSSIPPSFDAFNPLSDDAIHKLILSSPTKSGLVDPWPTFLVKECIDILLPSITRLVNYSLSEGHVPDGFKKAVVTPLIKKASLPVDDLKSYKVSGLSFISKLVERVVARQL